MNPPDISKPDVGLPPVQPPSARFIGQLFVIPGLIILVVVVLFIVSTLLVKREREPNFFLQQLDSDNMDIRWRGASDLAQILKRPEPATLRWKADVAFALDLAERLDTARKDLLEEEQKIAAEVAKSVDKDKHLLWRKLRPQRDLMSFLASALGEFHAPVGAPILCTIVKHDNSADLKGNTLQQRKALWALMNMGENLKGFATMPREQQETSLAALREEAGKRDATRELGANGMHYLEPESVRIRGQEGYTRVDETLVAVAESEDTFLRALVAMAFTFWDGPQAEATLMKLAHDNGRGTLLRVEESD